MALPHDAQLVPTKHDLLTEWVPNQPWLGGADAGQLEPVSSFRFDDPADEVGIETHLLRTRDGRLLQVPFTYRAAPLDGGEPALVATMEHSVLGSRWVYDGCADPVYVAAVAHVIATGGRQADLELERDGGRVPLPPRGEVRGSGGQRSGPAVTAPRARVVGATTVVEDAGLRLVLRRVLDVELDPGDAPVLTGTWPGSATPTLLAVLG